MREVVSARYYGTRWEMDTFLAAATIPTILFGVFNGALVSALVPTFSEYLAHRKEDEAWRLASTVLNILAIVLTLCAIVGYFTAPWYVPLIAHGFPAPQMGVAIRMTRWLMPSIVAVSLSGVLAAMLNAYHRFRSTALVGVAVNVVTIALRRALRRTHQHLRARARHGAGLDRADARAAAVVPLDRKVPPDHRPAPSRA